MGDRRNLPTGYRFEPGQEDVELHPRPLLLKYWQLFQQTDLTAPVVDLACGYGHNGLFLASRGIPVTLIDRSATRLSLAGKLARDMGGSVEIRQLDLEAGGASPIAPHSFGGMLVFRYLHRPLIAQIKNALLAGSILIYETFTVDQPKYGRPHNPDFLLKSGELKAWFSDWEVIHYFEGLTASPEQAMAQIVCRKPAERGDESEPEGL